MAISTFKRKELKFLLSFEQYKAFVKEISPFVQADKYCKNGKTYGIYNLYFDTEDNFLIRTSIEKPYFKEKLRLRSYYQNAKPTDKVFLELKRKVGGTVTKRRSTMRLNEAQSFLMNGISPIEISYIDKQVLAEISSFIKLYKPKPRQYISYQREAYFSKEDKGLRITFDSSIFTRRTDLSLASQSYGDLVIDSSNRLLEIKTGNGLPLWLVNSLSNSNIYRTSFSKYGKAYNQYLLNDKLNEQRRAIHA